MKLWKHFLSLMLALALCLCLAACGGGSDGGTPDDDAPADDAPDSLEDLVKDSLLMADLDAYGGVWTGEDGSTMTVEPAEAGDEVRFALYDAAGDVTASGFIQSVPDYGCDYFYNEHDGMAYRSWSEEYGGLHVASLGAFAKVSGDLPGENIGDSDFAALAGTWYLDGDAGAPSVIEIDEAGGWTLYERADGDGDMTAVDSGTLSADPDTADLYYASSARFDDTVYDMTVAAENTLYWGGEYDCYLRAA